MFLNNFLKLGMSTFVCSLLFFYSSISYSQEPVDYVNPFIGTSNFGTTIPGPVSVRGMMSVSPFNVAGPQIYL